MRGRDKILLVAVFQAARTRNVMKFVAYFIFLMSLTFPIVKAEPNSGFDELLDQYHQQIGFSGSVLVMRNGKPLLAKAVGNADDTAPESVTLQTRFDIGSIQKNLTAVLVLQAHDKGLLNLEDTVDKFSLGFTDPQTRKITIEHLLEHRSGFGDIFTAEYRKNPGKYETINEKLEVLRDAPLLFKPGSNRKYSNYGYIVLGAILEKTTGQNYWELLEENVFQPSRNLLTSEQLSHKQNKLAEPYHLSYDGRRLPVAPNLREHKSPDGGGQMSVFELFAFYHDLFIDKKLLSAGSLKAFRALQKDQQQWLAFGGGVGVSTAVELDFVNDTWVIILANTDRLVAERLSSRLRELLATGKYTEVKVSPQLFTYRFYKQKKEETFVSEFEAAYEKAGYRSFMGKVVTDLARELIADEKGHEAIPLLQFLTTRYPDVPDVYDGLAFGYLSIGKVKEAQEVFSKALNLQKDYQSQFSSDNYQLKEN